MTAYKKGNSPILKARPCLYTIYQKAWLAIDGSNGGGRPGRIYEG